MAQSLEQIFRQAPQNKKYLKKLLDYGRQKGFENFLNRKLIWPYLLAVNLKDYDASSFEWDNKMDENSHDYQQLQKDAERSLASMRTFENITKFHLQKRQKTILNLLDKFFTKNKDLRYVQGFHDVASIFLMLFGANHGYYMIQKAGKTYFKDFLTQDVADISISMSSLILQLLASQDSDFNIMFECYIEMKLLTFIVPWILTWFAHVFSSIKIICRIWDYLFCTGPKGIVYLSTGILLSTKQDLIQYAKGQYDQAVIHTFFQEKAKNESIDIEKSIKFAIELQSNIKLESLQSYKQLKQKSIFRPTNFEDQIDLHRQVFQYSKEQQKAFAKKKKIYLTATAIVLIGGFTLLKYGKGKFFHL